MIQVPEIYQWIKQNQTKCSKDNVQCATFWCGGYVLMTYVLMTLVMITWDHKLHGDDEEEKEKSAINRFKG